MSQVRIAPTRSNLIRFRRRMERVARGVDLLTRKRRAIAAELFRVAAPAIEAQARVNDRATAAYTALLAVRAARDPADLAASGWPSRQIEVDVTALESWGVAIGEVRRLTPVRRSLAARGQAPGLTGPATGSAAADFEVLLELLLDAASAELRLRRLADALRRTSRQVNTLERRVAPELDGNVRKMRALLEEREREDHTRLKHLRRKRD